MDVYELFFECIFGCELISQQIEWNLIGSFHTTARQTLTVKGTAHQDAEGSSCNYRLR